jgi:hypothetical protein
MSTTMRNVRMGAQGQTFRRGQLAAPPTWKRSIVLLEKWASAHAMLASVALAVAYLASLVALVAVLATATFNTLLGFGVTALFGVMVVASVAVAIYTLTPEKHVT